MRKIIALAVSCSMMTSSAMAAAPCDITSGVQAQPVFAPEDDVESMIVTEMGKAQQQILVQAYLLTSRNIAHALIDAKRRGVHVSVLADANQQAKVETSQLSALAKAGIAVWLETRYQNAHNKIILIDPDMPRATVITGSFNFTWTAQHKNAENMLVIRNSVCVASRYMESWVVHRNNAVAYRK